MSSAPKLVKRDTVTLLPTITISVPDHNAQLEVAVATPDFAKMSEAQFDVTMRKALLDAGEANGKCGLVLYNIIVPGLEYAEQLFAQGKIVHGCKGKEEYIESLGLKPSTVRKWKQRSKELKERLTKGKQPLLPGETEARKKHKKKNPSESNEAKVERPDANAIKADDPESTVRPDFGTLAEGWKKVNGKDPRYMSCVEVWVHPDGRHIRTWGIGDDPAEDGTPAPITYQCKDEWGALDKPLSNLEEAKKCYRPSVPPNEIFEMADQMARGIFADDDSHQLFGDVAEKYLIARRIELPDEGAEIEPEKGNRRKPRYVVTLDIEASRLATVEKKAKEIFGDSLKHVEKVSRNFSRADDLGQAEELIGEAAQIVSELKGQMEEWRDNMPEGLQCSEKYNEVEQCVDALESLESDLENISFENVEFPGMF